MSRTSSGGTLRQRADGRWEGRYMGADGRQHSVYDRNKTECRKKLRARMCEVDTGAWIERRDITAGQWLDEWLATCCGQTRSTTRRSYAGAIARMKPVIGRVRLQDLDAARVRRLQSRLLDEGYAPSTVSNTVTILATALKVARQARLIADVPTDDVPRPRQTKPEMHIIDRPQLPEFLAQCARYRCGSALTALLLTGLRIGELRALRWSDVDLDAATLTVRRQLVKASSLPWHFADAKDGSNRTIVLTAAAVRLLRSQRAAQAERRLAAGANWQEDEFTADLVFRTSTGGFLRNSHLARTLHTIGERIGLPGLHIHDLRHSYAVAALRAGVDVKTVQHNLGHASAAMTLDVYAAYTTDAGRTAAAKLDAWYRTQPSAPDTPVLLTLK